jgi:hypothetical protein
MNKNLSFNKKLKITNIVNMKILQNVIINHLSIKQIKNKFPKIMKEIYLILFLMNLIKIIMKELVNKVKKKIT